VRRAIDDTATIVTVHGVEYAVNEDLDQVIAELIAQATLTKLAWPAVFVVFPNNIFPTVLTEVDHARRLDQRQNHR